MNSCTFTGRLGETPEVRQTSNGTAVCKFSLAVERPKAPGAEDTVDWLTMIAWEKKAEFVGRHLTKGRKVLIQAVAQTRSFTDKNNSKHNVVEFRVDKIEFCDSKPQAQGEEQTGAPSPSYGEYPDFNEIQDDDLPF